MIDPLRDDLAYGPRTLDGLVVVHAGGPGRSCRTAIVIDVGPPTGLSRFRILNPSIGPIGSQDDEGDLRHWSQVEPWPNPDGTVRVPLSWHRAGECATVVYP